MAFCSSLLGTCTNPDDAGKSRSTTFAETARNAEGLPGSVRDVMALNIDSQTSVVAAEITSHAQFAWDLTLHVMSGYSSEIKKVCPSGSTTSKSQSLSSEEDAQKLEERRQSIKGQYLELTRERYELINARLEEIGL